MTTLTGLPGEFVTFNQNLGKCRIYELSKRKKNI